MVCAGSHDTFEIFVWSMQTGRLLEVRTSDCMTIAFCEATRVSASKNSTTLVPRHSLSLTQVLKIKRWVLVVSCEQDYLTILQDCYFVGE